MMDLPKCHCFQGGFESSQGQEYVDTISSEVVHMVTQAIRHYPVCPEALPYFLATQAASVLLSWGVVECAETELDVALMQKKALEVLSHVQGVIEMRCAQVERDRAGEVN